MRLPPGYALASHERLDSTNAEALRLAEAGAPHGTVVVARSQIAGRGRRGRAWESLDGNLFLTVLVRPPRGAPLGELSFVAALALGDALAGVTPVRFKWPNDVLVDGRKVAGILIEADHGAAAVGIGVNVVRAPEATPVAAGHLGDRIERLVLAERICGALEDRYRSWLAGGFAPVRADWLARAAGLGGPLTARLPDRVLAGTFRGIAADGALLLETEGGETAVPAGEVFFGGAACS